MSDELCFMTATELRRHIAHRELSPVEVTRAVLERAERLQPELNCFITICADEALAQAKDAEQALMRGEPLGLLHGVPYTCKDVIDTQGIRTTYGSLLHAQHVPVRDAEVVARLRRQGAVLVGKTTTPEFAAKCLTDAPLSVARATPGAPHIQAAGRAAAQPSRSRHRSRPSVSQPMAVAPRASQPPATASSVSSRAADWCPTARPTTSTAT